MRKLGRSVVIACFWTSLLAWAAPALAGGGGGVCYEQPPVLDVGWVAVGDNCFSPRSTEVNTGDAVRFKLVGRASHTVTFDAGPDAGTLTGDGFAVQLNAPGTYDYACSFHPGMTGTIQAIGEQLGGPAVTVLGGDRSAQSGSAPVVAVADRAVTRLEFSPLAALVILLVGLPMSLAATLRLVGIAGPSPVRLRVPWERRRSGADAPARR
jgi:hypothetical protein